MPYLIHPASDLEGACAEFRVGLLKKKANHAAD